MFSPERYENTQTNSERFVILGCGHTGSTLISGIMNISGFKTLPPISGMYESRELNRLCNILIGRNKQPHLDLTIDSFLNVLETHTGGKWSLKDPLLPFVFPMIYNRMIYPCKVIFNFRHPGPTVAHLMKGRRRFRNDLTEKEAWESAEKEYTIKNRHALDFIEKSDIEHLLIDYDDLLEGHAHESLNRFVGSALNYQFIDPAKRKAPQAEVSDTCVELYEQLKCKARKNHEEVSQNYDEVDEPIDWVNYVNYLREKHSKDIRKLLPHFIYQKYFSPPKFSHIRPPYPEYNNDEVPWSDQEG